MTTFTQHLLATLRTDPGRPLVTFYDDATGERVELSATTYANWVAKVAGLLADELDLERGQRLRIDLPTHWLVPVFLGAAWTVGLVVDTGDGGTGDAGPPDAVVCGPGSLTRWAPYAEDVAVLACALLPLGVRFADPVPTGVHDVGVEVWSQPDAFSAADPPTGADPAALVAGAELSHDRLWADAEAGNLLEQGGRLGTERNPAGSDALGVFTEPLARRGSLVLVAGSTDPARLASTYAAERVTAQLPPA